MIIYSRKATNKYSSDGHCVYLYMIQLLKWGVRIYRRVDGVTRVSAYYFNPVRQIKQWILESHANWALKRLEQTKGKRWNPIEDGYES